MDTEYLKEYLKRKGATLVGVGDVTQALSRELIHLTKGISLAMNRGLTRDTNQLLAGLQKLTQEWLKKQGYRSFSIPPDSDRWKDKLITRLYPLVSHKTAATCSGLGWIGKNGLIINEFYGSKLSWSTVLTDAPLTIDRPITESQCGDCDLCVKHCPSGAVTGNNWSRRDPLQEIVRYERCRSLKGKRRHFSEKPNCGLCITICPYSRNGLSHPTGNRKSEQEILQKS